MTPRQVAQSVFDVVRQGWQTLLVLGVVITAAATGLKKIDQLLLAADKNAGQISALVKHVDSLLHWSTHVNMLFCSPIYPERAAQAALLGLCPSMVAEPQPPATRARPR
jgi:hypothetical protein